MNRFSRYLDTIARVNDLGERPVWYFYPGMLQDSWDKWWAEFFGRRHACHEGIDICFYNAGQGVRPIFPGAAVPALADGVVLHISKDLLGQSMAVSYAPDPEDNRMLPDGYIPVLVYSHLEPEKGLAPGSRIIKDQIIANIFDTRKKKSKLLSHLHFSCILLPESIPADRLCWSLFADRDIATYVNPVFI